MAERRMFAKTIIDSDAFLEMPMSAQLLYFHMSMRGDDDGFINKPRAIMRMCGCHDDDMKLLFAKKFVIPFESGVVVIKHWKIHNYIRKDMYTETKYKEEKALLEMDENNAYRLACSDNDTTPLQTCNEPVTVPSTQVRLGQERLVQDSTGEERKGEKRENTHSLFQRLLPEYSFSDSLVERIEEWIIYKAERKDAYKEQGLKALLRQIENNAKKYGDQPICDLIEESMANGWKGIIFDKLKQKEQETKRTASTSQGGNVFLDIAKDENLVF